MKSRLTLAVAIAFILALSLGVNGIASGAVATFDDLTLGEDVPIPNGYAGFNWNNMYAFDPIADGYLPGEDGEGYINGIVSPNNVAYNGWGNMAITSLNSGTFDFNGAYFTSAWEDDNVLTLVGKLDGNVLFSLDVTLMTSGPLWVDADFAGIDELVFTTSKWQFALDNFTYNHNQTSVPEPATLLLFGLGLLGIGGIRKRMK